MSGLNYRNYLIMIIIITIIIIIIMNPFYIAQFDTNGIFTALHIVIMYIQTQYMHIWTYMKQSYSYTYTSLFRGTLWKAGCPKRN